MYYNVYGEKISRRHFTEKCEAARNRRELIAAGLTSRRDLFKMGLLTAGGMLVAKSGLSARAQTQTPQITPTANQTQTNNSPNSGTNPIPMSLIARQEKQSPGKCGQFFSGGTSGKHGNGRPWRSNNFWIICPRIQTWGAPDITIFQARKEEISGKNVRAVYPGLLGSVVVRCVGSRPMQGNNNPRTYSRFSG